MDATKCCGEIRTCQDRECIHALRRAAACRPIPEAPGVGCSDTDVFPTAEATHALYGRRNLIGYQTPEGLVRVADTKPSATPASDYSDTKPAYYHAGPDDLIAFALKHDIGPVEFTIMRYVMRWKQKQPLLSLRKAREYLDRLIEHAEKMSLEVDTDA